MFHPQTDTDREKMLADIGVKSIEELFDYVPEEIRYPDLDLPKTHSEMEAYNALYKLHTKNVPGIRMPNFLGAGAYRHYVPAVVDSILRRGEFFTAYTPYQPEISQGTLQAIFEYQSHVINLTGMEASNASHYDGATAAAEAVNMAFGIARKKRKKAIVSPAVHPHYRETIDTYFKPAEFDICGEDLDPSAGPEFIMGEIDDNTACVVVQYPDFFGRVYDYTELGKVAHEAGALLVMVVNPMALGLLKAPSEFDADIVCGEGQPFGIGLSYGGPYLGMLATKKKFVRSLAGRIVGQTEDLVEGVRGFVLTLSAREQHIRRERASSNICSNQGLMALAATIYLTMVGKDGLREVAELCYQNAHYAASQINALEGYELMAEETFFNEFVIKCAKPAAEINKALLDKGIIGGYEIGKDYDDMDDRLMFAVTEMNGKEEIDSLVAMLAEVA